MLRTKTVGLRPMPHALLQDDKVQNPVPQHRKPVVVGFTCRRAQSSNCRIKGETGSKQCRSHHNDNVQCWAFRT